MPTITVTDTQGDSQEIQLTTGLSLMELLRDAGYEEIEAICGGCCSCATCHVHIDINDAHGLPEIEEDEEMLISIADSYEQGVSRLSCQIHLEEQHAGLKVTLVEPE